MIIKLLLERLIYLQLGWLGKNAHLKRKPELFPGLLMKENDDVS